MIDRYSTEEMRHIWSNQNKFKTWLDVEIYSIEAYSKVNKEIKKSDIKAIKNKVKINEKRIQKLEVLVKHDVIAFTRQISEALGPEKKWIHYGLTSTDVVDTAQSFRIKQANKLILHSIKALIKTIKFTAKKHMLTYQMGRTHGIHAEITTFGYKMALWYDEMSRNLKRFIAASDQIEIAKISGAVGNYANVPLSVQNYVAKKLKLGSSKISNQTLQRDRHAEYIFTLGLIATSLDKFATEIRHLQRTEVREVQEGFENTQKGSSAMPHKRNPIASENISGLSRVLRGYITTTMQDVALWHERDISHSSAERIIIPDSTSILEYMLIKFNNVLKNLEVNKKQMLKNIDLTCGAVFSQRVMLYLIEHKNISREEAYDLIQPIAMEAFDNKISFASLLLERQLLTQKEAHYIFDLKYYSQNIPAVFKRMGL